MKITKNTVLAKVLENKKAEKILAKYAFPCISCPFLKQEINKLKIGEVCENYGIDADKLIKELNEKL